MSPKEKVSHIVVATDDQSMFAGAGDSRRSPSRKLNSAEREPRSGKPSAEMPSNSLSPKMEPSHQEQINEFVRPLLESREQIAGMVIWEDRVVVSVVKCDASGQVILQSTAELEFPESASDAQCSSLLRKWWKQCKFGTRSVWVGVDSGHIAQKYFSLPVPEEGLDDALFILAEEVLHDTSAQTVFDYILFDKNKPTDPSAGMMYACSEQILLRYKRILENAGLLVCGFCVPSVELARTFRFFGPPVSSKFAECVLLLTKTTAEIVILFGESSLYSRRIETISGDWGENLDYLIQSVNDAFMYFQLYLSSDTPVGRIHLAGVMPDSQDMAEFFLRESGLVVQRWVPTDQKGPLVVSSSCKGAIPGLAVSSLGLAMRRD